MLNYWVAGDWTYALGFGNKTPRYVLITIWIFAIQRIVFCAFPANGWFSSEPSMSWAIYRNVPFACMGLLTVVYWAISSKLEKEIKTFCLMWLAVLLSFGFYIPVVLWAHTVPVIGMLMLPKTVMFIWIICMFKKAAKENSK